MCEICYTPFLRHEPRMAATALGWKDKYWTNGTRHLIAISDASQEVIDHVMRAAQMWAAHCGLSFDYTDTWTQASCRIAIAPGASWSYIGTDNRHITAARPTMNLGWIHRDIADSDLSTALHEIGHYLGLGHEHQNPNEPFDWDEATVIRELSGPPNNWDEATIRHNVLNRVPIDEVDATTLDRDSIMMYFMPDRWLRSGQGTRRNSTLSALDKYFIGYIYPRSADPAEDTSVQKLLRGILYSRRKIDVLDRRQCVTILGALGKYYEPKERTRDLRTRVKNAIT